MHFEIVPKSLDRLEIFRTSKRTHSKKTAIFKKRSKSLEIFRSNVFETHTKHLETFPKDF